MRLAAALVGVAILIVATVAYVSFSEYESYNSSSGTCEREAAQGSSQVGFILISPSIKVQFGTTSGVLGVKIGGSACSPITGFEITSMRPILGGVVNTPFVQYQGSVIGPNHPEPVGEPASGSINVSNVTVGQEYSMNYTVTTAGPNYGSSGALTFTATGYTPLSFSLDKNLTSAIDYLLADYNPKLGLIPETPNSSVYWLYSDNYLAALALSQYGGADLTIAHTGANISVTLYRYLPLAKAYNQYTAIGTSLCAFSPSQNYTIGESNGYHLETTVNNGTGSLSGEQYADIAFLNAICLQGHGNTTAAVAAYDQAAKFFDGVGMRDLPYNQTGQYQTYKLALFLYASAALDQPFNTTALSTLLRMQAPDGGFYTGYDASYSHQTTLTNTETTSLVILALERVESQTPG